MTIGNDPSTILDLQGIGKSYAGIDVLRDVNIDIGSGEVVALAGENGAGKSTILAVITGLIAPSAGQVLIDGRPVHPGWSPAMARKAGVASVQQELSLNPHQTLAENVFLGRWPTTGGLVRRSDIETRARQLLARVGLDRHPATPVRRLALAERQLVEIAKALASAPRLLILDEATSALDDEQVRRVLDLVRELRSTGTSTIFVTHRMSEMFAVSDRFVVLKDGAVVDVRHRSDTTTDDLITSMLGRSLTELFPHKAQADDHPRGGLKLQGLTIGQVNGLDLDVKPGQIVGLGGLQGHGQREVLRALFGLEKHHGATFVDGKKTRLSTPRVALAHHIAFVPEDRKVEGVLLEQSVGDNLELPNLTRLAPWSRLTTVSLRASEKLVGDMIATLQIKADARQKVRRLSGGNQQKVALAKWLPSAPRVLLLAEPTRGIDVGTKKEIYRQLRGFADDGMAILITSGDTLELIGLCDEVVVMYEGRKVTTLSGERLTEQHLVEASVVGAHAEDEGAA